MSGVDECRRRGLWCDGFSPEGFDLVSRPQRITGKAWICYGKDQEAWPFDPLLPSRIGARGEIRWSELLPHETTTRC